MRTFYHCLLISIALGSTSSAIYAQKARRDSLLHLLEGHPANDAQRLDLLNKVVWANMYIDPISAMKLGDESIALARSLGDDRALAVALDARVSLDQMASAPTDRSKELIEALAIERRLGLQRELAWTLIRETQNDRWQGRSDTARATLLEAGRIFHALKDTEGEGVTKFYQYLDLADTDPDRAAALFDQGMALLEGHGHLEWMIIALNRKAYAAWWNSRIEEALAISGHALELAQRTTYDLLIMTSHSTLGSANRDAGRYGPAAEHFLEAMRINEAQHDYDAMALACLNLGPIYMSTRDTTQAIDWYERGYEMARKATRPDLMTYALNGLGKIHEIRKEYTMALARYEKALSLCSSRATYQGQQGFDQCEAQAYLSIGEVKSGLGDVLGSKAAYHTALAAAERNGLAWEMSTARAGLAKTLLAIPDSLLRQAGLSSAQERDRSAIELGLKALAPALENGWAPNRRSALEALTEGYERRHDPVRALQYMKELLQVKDSLLTADKAEMVSGLEIRYQTEKKEQQIVLLGKDKEVQAKEIQKQKLVRNGFMGGFALVLVFAGVFFFQRNRISKARKRSDELLLNILPAEVAEELKAKGEAEAVHIDQVTVLFTDFKGFTAMSEVLTPQQLVRDLNECFSAFDHITGKYGIEKIKTIGDAYMAAGGLPTPNTTHATDVINAAFEMRDFIAEGRARKVAAGLPYFEIRIGIHTGPVVAGIVGVKKFQYDIWGDTVNTASRMESSGEVGQVNISETTYDLVKGLGGLAFTSRGKVQAKGKGEMEMYFVRSA